MIDSDLIEDFYDKSGFDLNPFLEKYYEFYTLKFPNLVSFYTGKSDSLKADHFTELDELIENSKSISAVFRNNDFRLNTLRFWDLIEYVTDLHFDLLMLRRIDKFLKSSVSNSTYSSDFKFEHTFSEDTLEDVASRILKEEDYNNTWVELAKDNDLDELSYNRNDGRELTLSIKLLASSLSVESIVDNLQGENILGKDLKKKLQFVSDDLLTLNPQDTFEQTIDILSNLSKGDIPEFRNLGRNVFIGSNIRIFAFSSLIRELTNIFSTDDTLSQFSVDNMSLGEFNDISLSFSVSSRLNLVINKELKIN